MTYEFIDRFEVIAELGRGGMATVYHAYDPDFDRPVAVKIMPREFLHVPDFQTRFQREARIIANLEHGAIVPVYELGEHDDLPYLVMRYMAGGSLSDRIARESLATAEVIRLFDQIAPAVDKAHAQGFVHRDLKPDNILFDADGNAFIADFGIAKLMHSTSQLTGSGALVGTPAYMSPEQIMDQGEIDHRSDLYSLGVILYQVLTGQMPFLVESAHAYYSAHLNNPVPDIRDVKPDLPPAFTAIIHKAMAKDKDERYMSAAEIAADVAHAPDAEAAVPHAERTWPDPVQPDTEQDEPIEAGSSHSARRLPLPMIIGAFALIAFVGILLSGILGSTNPDPVADQPRDQSESTSTNIPDDEPADVFARLNFAGKIVYSRDNDIYVMNADGSDDTRLTIDAGNDALPRWSPDGSQILFISESRASHANREIYVMNADGTGQTRLTGDKARDTDPDWSPDGTQIVFVSTRDGGFTELFVMDSDGMNIAQLTNEGRTLATPAWSPDGTRIAYTSTRDGDMEIVVIDADGSNRRQLTANNTTDQFPVWSPDGTQIAYVSDQGTLAYDPQVIVLMTPDGDPLQTIEVDPNWSIGSLSWSPDGAFLVTEGYIIHPDSGAVHAIPVGSDPDWWNVLDDEQVTELPTPDLPDQNDGWIAFDSDRDDNLEVYKIRADGEMLTRLTDHDAPDYDPSWSPDGAQLVFVSERDGNPEIYLMDADGGGLVRLTDDPGIDDQPAWSPDGSQIAFVSERDGNREVYIMDTTGQNLTRITDNPEVDEEPAWSSDGSQLVFVSNRDHPRDVYMSSADGSSPVRITYSRDPSHDLAEAYAPALDPTSSYLAYISDRSGAPKVYIFNLSFEQELAGNLGQQAPVAGSLWHSLTWSPDGRWLLVSSRLEGEYQLNISSPDGTIQSQLTTGNVNNYNPDWWSPLPDNPADTQSLNSGPSLPQEGWIVYDTDLAGNREIYKMQADGSSLARLTEHEAPDYDPAWSPDGSQIVFVSERDGSPELYVMDAEGGNLTRLTNDPAIDDQPAWSPDGTQIAFISTRDGNPEVYVMAADGSNLSRLTDNPGLEEHPAWSGDGLQLAYISDQDGDIDVYVLNLDDPSLTRLTDSQLSFNLSRASMPAWDPTNPRIAFASDRGGEEVFVFDITQGIERYQTNPAIGVDISGAFPHSLTWSPDGLWLLLSTRIQGDYQLSLASLEGAAQFQLSTNNANHYNPDWWAPPSDS